MYNMGMGPCCSMSMFKHVKQMMMMGNVEILKISGALDHRLSKWPCARQNPHQH